MDLEFSWPVGRIKEAIPELGSFGASSPTSCSLETTKAIAALVDQQNIPEAKIGLASGVSVFLWLYISIHGCKPAKATVTSELPLGSGLGSSAAFCVALSSTLLALSDSVKLDFGHQGNMIKFKSGELTRIKTNMPLKMLITNTKVGRNTKALVAGASERTVRHPTAMAAVFVDSISNEMATIIQSPVSDDLAITEKEEKLEELMEMNQGLLQYMGVSHASIESVLRIALKFKLSSKLTGAGGGGCVLTLLRTYKFCYNCIWRWTKVAAYKYSTPPTSIKCPLCKTENFSIIHGCDGISFQRHYIGQDFHNSDFFTKAHKYRLQSYYCETGTLVDIFNPTRYWKLHKYLQPSHWLYEWIRREIQALTQEEDVEIIVHHILGVIESWRRNEQTSSRTSPEAKRERFRVVVSEAARRFLTGRTNQFVNELEMFLASGLNVDAYDKVYLENLGWKIPEISENEEEPHEHAPIVPNLQLFDEDSDYTE